VELPAAGLHVIAASFKRTPTVLSKGVKEIGRHIDRSPDLEDESVG
jgi:hypothetical protein